MTVANANPQLIGFFSKPKLRYPSWYMWYIIVSTMDIVFTWCILHIGGSEANPVADAVIQYSGLPGVMTFKYCLVLVVILLAEITGRVKNESGLFIAQSGVTLTCIPIVVALLHLTRWVAA